MGFFERKSSKYSFVFDFGYTRIELVGYFKIINLFYLGPKTDDQK